MNNKLKMYVLFTIIFLAGHFVNHDSKNERKTKHLNLKLDQDNSCQILNENKWKDLNSIKNVVSCYPEKLTLLFNSLDLTYEGLSDVGEALAKADTIAASNALIKYYKNRERPSWLLRDMDEFSDSDERRRANQILEDIFTRRNVTTEIPKLNYGGWKWSYTGPEKDDEFGYTLNRHEYFLLLLKGWHDSGKDVYAKKFDTLIRDWIINNPLPDNTHRMWEVLRTTTSELDWRDIEEVIWRVLEAGIRAGNSWPQAFYGFQDADEFSPAGRLLILSSIPVHAQYLKEHHAVGHNHGTMELNGLGLLGLAFPEFQHSADWFDYALDKMEDELNIQVYPDGVQTELTSTYQLVALRHFETLIENYRSAGRFVSDAYLNGIEDMYNYLAYSMRPDGHQPLNNDSDRDDLKPKVLKAAKKFNRQDWEYIVTNGTSGEKPKGLTSTTFPWAGLHIMRNSWASDSHWAMFDTGPFGTGHQHADMLHLSIHAYGRDLLVDSGRFTHENYFSFDPKTWRGYFRSSFSQNVILIDGKGQSSGPLKAEKPLKEGINYVHNQLFDYARGTFSSGFADGTDSGFSKNNVIKAEHTRAVFYVKDEYWVVVDRVRTDETRVLEVLWNPAPDVNVEIEGNQIVSNDENKGNIRIVPVGNIPWSVEITKGQTEPFIRGWYSETYGKKEEISTAVYSTKIDGSATFAWVLVPAFGTVPKITAAELIDEGKVEIKVKVENGEQKTLVVPLTQSYKPKLQN